jgi:hypothetical protein
MATGVVFPRPFAHPLEGRRHLRIGQFQFAGLLLVEFCPEHERPQSRRVIALVLPENRAVLGYPAARVSDRQLLRPIRWFL